MQRGNGISAGTRRLPQAIDNAFHAHDIYDCDMFVIKYMEYWNRATLTHSLAEDKMHLYRLSVVVNLLMNEANNVRNKVI
ncbi:hypothetical protein CK203_042454 [Vitis vinifera]|uniref:Ubiquitin-like protease family profile domain-containing protein n=1 Tax=Vitis vinifera TaxID=29760 RepID=A0A438HEX3_VITVI|nr:hypothetical protein CK203_042454 [Vitis vinifera]